MNFIKRILPVSILKTLRPIYHGVVAHLANFLFGRPSERLIVIGVTGTNGKSTAVNLIAKILNEAGIKCGYTSTVNFNIGGREKLNDLKMTMPSGWLLHKWMAEMLKAGCKAAVLEISSEGLVQNRHMGINFDIAVFTNLTPEHIQAHGGFEEYKFAKSRLFRLISKTQFPISKKNLNITFKKTIIYNADDEHGKFYGSFSAQKHISFAIKDQEADFIASGIEYSPYGIKFSVFNLPASPAGRLFSIKLKGKFDVYNSLAAIAAAQSLEIPLEICKTALEKVPGVPGRMEVIQEQPFMVLVDYAPEPYSLKACYDTIKEWPKNRLIHVLGSCGGGRDVGRRKILGQMAGQTADIAIVTNEDPYDDDPQVIIDDVAAGVLAAGKKAGGNLFKILDRREGIKRALSLAKPGDVILITGKGAEQKMAVKGGRYIDWDDRKVVREELNNLSSSSKT